MRAVCVKSYYDKRLKRTVTKGEELELSNERIKELSTKNNSAKEILVEVAETNSAAEKKVKADSNILELSAK